MGTKLTSSKGLLRTRMRNSSLSSTAKKQKISANTNYIPVAMAFVVFFIYGFLLLMVGYTGGSIVHGETALKNFAMLSPVPQTIGLIIVVLALKFLVKNYNMRWIMMTGFVIAFFSLVLLVNIHNISDGNLTSGTIVYVLANFMLGIGVGAVSPGIVVYFSQRFTGTTRNVMLSTVNGVYGIGAGIMPLALASVLYSRTSQDGIGAIKSFVIVAIILAVVGFVFSFFLNVPPVASDALNIKESIDKRKRIPFENKFMTQKKLMLCIGIVVFLFAAYMFVETTANYNLFNIIKGPKDGSYSDNDVIKRNVTAFHCIGLMFIVQGLWRAGSGLTICKKVRYRHFLLASVLLIVIAYILMLTNLPSPNENVNKYFHHYTAYAYLVALLLAFGLGNIWPVLTSYATEIENSRAALISIWTNRTAQIMILVTQLIVGFCVASGHIPGTENSNWPNTYKGVFIAAIVVAALFFIVLVTFSYILKAWKIPNRNDSEKIYKKINFGKKAYKRALHKS